MANSFRDDSHLDAAIDRAVRDMMSAEPRTDLRERVLAELTGAPARTRLWPRLAFGSAALAIAAVALLVFVERPADRPVERVAVATPPPAPASPAAEAPAAPSIPSGAVDRDTARRGGLESAAAAREKKVADRPVQAASIAAGEAVGIEPMTPVEPLRPLEPIRIATLVAPSASAISIVPITIERIEITPLSPQR